MSRMASVSDRWWVRSLLGADRGAWALVRVAEAVRDEVLRARLSVAEQEALTLECYARSTTYGPGGSAFEAGLFPWEELALAHPRWPRAGRVLLGAAGAGREARALAARGHRVSAFEPCAPLVAQGRAQAMSGVNFLAAGYEAWTAARDGSAWWPADDAPTGVVLGWGSLSHVLEASGRSALLEATRRLAPGAPVLVSFLVPWERGARDQQLRRGLRRVLGTDETGPVWFFSTEAGCARLFDLDDIRSLASGAGYEVVMAHLSPYGHALLVPRG